MKTKKPKYKPSIYELMGYLEGLLACDTSIESSIQMCQDTFRCSHREVMAAFELMSEEEKGTTK